MNWSIAEILFVVMMIVAIYAAATGQAYWTPSMELSY